MLLGPAHTAAATSLLSDGLGPHYGTHNLFHASDYSTFGRHVKVGNTKKMQRNDIVVRKII